MYKGEKLDLNERIVSPNELQSRLNSVSRMEEVLEQIRVWARNDINIRTGKGQTVGAVKFAGLHIAKDIESMINYALGESDKGENTNA